MPYIKRNSRHTVSSATNSLFFTAGELNYYITTKILEFLESGDGVSYATLNNAIGRLEGIIIGRTDNNSHDTWKLIRVLVDQFNRSHTDEDTLGVLRCCQLELYRRMVAPYEDKKIQENGDVY